MPTEQARGRDGELSEPQAAIMRIIFAGLGIVTIATVVLILEILVPIWYVVFGLIAIGIASVVYYDVIRSTGIATQASRPASRLP